MKRLTIKTTDGTEVVFGKLPLFTRNLKKEFGEEFDTSIRKLTIVGRYYAAEMGKSGVKETQTPAKEVDSILQSLSGNFYEKKEYYKPTAVSEPDLVSVECKNDVEENQDQKPKKKNKNKNKNHYKTGRMRYARLVELEKSGELAKCRDRLDLCEKLGFEEDNINHKRGYNWISNQLRKGFLKEILVGDHFKYELGNKEPFYGKEDASNTAKAKAVTSDLEELGFTNLKENSGTITKPRKIEALERGDARLVEWMKASDFVIYKMFVYGNGQVNVGKTITHSDIKDLFHAEGFPNSPVVDARTSVRMANVALSALLRGKILTKVDDSDSYTLSITKGGRYARRVYRTVACGKYKRGKNGLRELLDA